MLNRTPIFDFRGIMMRSLSCLAALMLLLGCSGADEKKDEGAEGVGVKIQTAGKMNQGGKPAGVEVERGDMNADGRPDVWKYTKEVPDPGAPGSTKPLVVKKEADLNFDGKKDVFIEYDDEIVTHEAFDFDYDGRVDQENFYKESKISEKRVFAPGTNKVFIWKYFEEGTLSRVRQDDNGDGIADRCEEWFKGQRLVRKGRDTNKDGECDDWENVR